jgi:hypothetical protein
MVDASSVRLVVPGIDMSQQYVVDIGDLVE